MTTKNLWSEHSRCHKWNHWVILKMSGDAGLNNLARYCLKEQCDTSGVTGGALMNPELRTFSNKGLYKEVTVMNALP